MAQCSLVSLINPPKSRCAHDTKLCIQGICICAGNIAAICFAAAFWLQFTVQCAYYMHAGEVVSTVQTVQQW